MLQGTCVVEIIDSNRYGVFNWLADCVWGNLTRNKFFYHEKPRFLSRGIWCDVNLLVSHCKQLTYSMNCGYWSGGWLYTHTPFPFPGFLLYFYLTIFSSMYFLILPLCPFLSINLTLFVSFFAFSSHSYLSCPVFLKRWFKIIAFVFNKKCDYFPPSTFYHTLSAV